MQTSLHSLGVEVQVALILLVEHNWEEDMPLTHKAMTIGLVARLPRTLSWY